jgi:hypothetical protein
LARPCNQISRKNAKLPGNGQSSHAPGRFQMAFIGQRIARMRYDASLALTGVAA